MLWDTVPAGLIVDIKTSKPPQPTGYFIVMRGDEQIAVLLHSQLCAALNQWSEMQEAYTAAGSPNADNIF